MPFARVNLRLPRLAHAPLLSFAASLAASASAHAKSSAPPRSASSAAPRITNIREHDFRNSVFHADFAHANVQLHDGQSYGREAGELGGRDSFGIMSIEYGDLDGDRADEAAGRSAVWDAWRATRSSDCTYSPPRSSVELAGRWSRRWSRRPVGVLSNRSGSSHRRRRFASTSASAT